ncbi:hypothetical protein GQ55_5G323700 [Panicum hallii var. hallii]|uniref:Uncharacterized protein n=1 Tax=Panicum hallii var. hallii TaxID=1504633 RepID=A0A2T7DLS3_9POAL|nr:hypothetical protein GQ55_5G323700 [Panicum hallii var. hallii]
MLRPRVLRHREPIPRPPLHPEASLSSYSGAAVDNSPNIDQGIKCDYSYNASTVCHITKLLPSLPGTDVFRPWKLLVDYGVTVNRWHQLFYQDHR